jgi:uncharacterized protein (DUF2267 family)
MRITKRLVQTAAITSGVIGLVAASAPDSPVGRAARRLADRLGRDLRYAVSAAPGILYRLAGRAPDPYVSDDLLADRIRSSIGPLEKRLDIPRVHVMVDEHIAVVHGDVPDEHTARAVERAILRVSGVEGVESHLHPGLVAGDTRPSEGAAVPSPPSDGLQRLLEAAHDAGAGADARAAVHAVLCGFTDRLPEREREQLLAQLPADVRALAGPVSRHGERAPRLRTVPQLVAAVVAEGGIDLAHAEAITRAVVGGLHDLAHAEARDVAAVLPQDLAELWAPQHATA